MTNTSWDLLRVCLLWNIWVQKCAQELNNEPFNMAKVLYYSWQTTIHIGMETWASIFRHKRGKKRHETLTAAFEAVWYTDNTFAPRGRKPQWQSIPPEAFMPQYLATELPVSHTDIPTRLLSSDSVSYD